MQLKGPVAYAYPTRLAKPGVVCFGGNTEQLDRMIRGGYLTKDEFLKSDGLLERPDKVEEQLFKMLTDPDMTENVLLSGPMGSGKSLLAAHLMTKLKQMHCSVYSLHGTTEQSKNHTQLDQLIDDIDKRQASDERVYLFIDELHYLTQASERGLPAGERAVDKLEALGKAPPNVKIIGISYDLKKNACDLHSYEQLQPMFTKEVRIKGDEELGLDYYIQKINSALKVSGFEPMPNSIETRLSRMGRLPDFRNLIDTLVLQNKHYGNSNGEVTEMEPIACSVWDKTLDVIDSDDSKQREVQ